MLDCRERESGRAPEESGAEGGQIAERRPSGPARQISIVSARWRRKADRAAPLRRCAPLTPASSSRAIDASHAPGRLVSEMPYRRSSSGTDGARQPGARQYGEFERLCWAGSRTCARQNNAAEWLAWWPGGGVVVVLVVLVVPSSRRPHLSHPPNPRRPRLRASLALARSCASAPRHTPLVCSAHTHTGLTAPSSPHISLSRSPIARAPSPRLPRLPLVCISRVACVMASEIPRPLPKAKRVSSACLNCRYAKVACSGVRPCARCVARCCEDSCLDIPRRPRTTKRRREESLMVRAPSSPPRPPALDAVSPCLRASSCLVLTSAIPRRVHVLLLLCHRHHYLHHLLAAVRLRLCRLRLSGLLLRWACECPCTHLHAPPITAAPALAPPACPPAPPPPRRRHVAGSPRVAGASPALGNQRHQALLLALLLLRLRSLLVVLFLVAVVVVDRGLCGTCAGAQTAARAAGGVARGHALQRLPRHCVGVRPRSNRLAVGPQVLQRHLPRHPQHRRTCTVTSVSPPSLRL